MTETKSPVKKTCLNEGSTPENGNVSHRSEVFPTAFHEIMFLAVSCLAQILTLFDTISNGLNALQNAQSWLMSSFSLTSGFLILITGHIENIYRLRKMVLIWYAVASIGALVSSLSHYFKSVNQFIAARALLQFMGVSCMLPNLVGIVRHTYKQGSFRKLFVISSLGAGAPIGAGMGGVSSPV